MILVHITTELFDFSYGGVGTYLTNKYNDKVNQDLFVFVSDNIDQVKMMNSLNLKRVLSFTLKDFFDLPIDYFSEQLIYTHNFFLFRNWKAKDNKLFMHSNLLIESMIDPEEVSAHAIEAQLHALAYCKKIVFVSHLDLHKSIECWTKSVVYQDYCQQILNQIKNNFYEIIHPTDISLPLRINHRSFRNSFSSEQLTFGYLGRLSTRKGINHLVEKFPDQHRLLMAMGGLGNFTENSYLKFVAEIKKRKTQNILPVGYCDSERKKHFLNKIDALIVPSLYEPFGLILLEAMESRCPLIVSKSVPIDEIFMDSPIYQFDPLENSLQSPDHLQSVLKKFSDDYLNLKCSEV